MDRLVRVSMGSCVGGWLDASVGMWWNAFVTVSGDPVFLIESFGDGDPTDPVFFCYFFSSAVTPARLWHSSAYHFCPLYRPRPRIVPSATSCCCGGGCCGPVGVVVAGVAVVVVVSGVTIVVVVADVVDAVVGTGTSNFNVPENYLEIGNVRKFH